MLPDRAQEARRKQGHEGHPHLVPAGIALPGCSLLDQCNQPTALLLVQVPRTAPPLSNDGCEVLALLRTEVLVHPVTRVEPEGPSDLPGHGPRHSPSSCPELAQERHAFLFGSLLILPP